MINRFKGIGKCQIQYLLSLATNMFCKIQHHKIIGPIFGRCQLLIILSSDNIHIVFYALSECYPILYQILYHKYYSTTKQPRPTQQYCNVFLFYSLALRSLSLKRTMFSHAVISFIFTEREIPRFRMRTAVPAARGDLFEALLMCTAQAVKGECF